MQSHVGCKRALGVFDSPGCQAQARMLLRYLLFEDKWVACLPSCIIDVWNLVCLTREGRMRSEA